MRKKFLGGNWKMNGDAAVLQALVEGLLAQLPEQLSADVAVFPPFVYLSQVSMSLAASSLQLGAQNHCQFEQGAYTGEVSALMLKDFACDYVLLGHSERRHVFAETNSMIAEKFKVAKVHGLMPVLCVGETEAQFEAGETESVIREQLAAVIDLVGIAALQDTVIAYEPVWAIGTGKVATVEVVQQVHAGIRGFLAEFDALIAEQTPIVYGGSLKPENAAAIFALPDVDGGLVGGASLQAESFARLYELLV